MQIGEKSIPGSGNCQCKGPGAGMDWPVQAGEIKGTGGDDGKRWGRWKEGRLRREAGAR